MKKKELEEFGILITREMKSVLLDANISLEDRARIIVSVITGEELENSMMRAFADSLRAGFVVANKKREHFIEKKRISDKKYQASLREAARKTSDTMETDSTPSRPIGFHPRPSPYNTVQSSTEQNKTYIPPISPKGDGRCPPEISVDDIFGGAEVSPAEALAAQIERTEAFAHARVNRRKLLRALNSVLEKNTGAEILAGIARWETAWAAEGWQYAPGSLAKWIADGKFLQEPRVKVEPERNEEIGVKEIV